MRCEVLLNCIATCIPRVLKLCCVSCFLLGTKGLEMKLYTKAPLVFCRKDILEFKYCVATGKRVCFNSKCVEPDIYSISCLSL